MRVQEILKNMKTYTKNERVLKSLAELEVLLAPKAKKKKATKKAK